MRYQATDRGIVQTNRILVFSRKSTERVLRPADSRPRIPRGINFTRVEIAALESRHGTKLVLFTSTNRPSPRAECGRTRDRMSPQTPIPVGAWAPDPHGDRAEFLYLVREARELSTGMGS